MRGGRSPPSPGAMDGAPGAAGAPGRAGVGGGRGDRDRRRADPPAREELVQDPPELDRVGVPHGDEPHLVEHDLHVEHAHDLEEPGDVGGGVGHDQQVALDDEVAALDERPEGYRDPVGRGVLERHDLGDQLVVAARRVGLAADDRRQRALADRRGRQNLVEVARANGGHAVDLEHGQQDVEDLVLRDPARSLDGDLLAGHARSDRVVEPGDLAGRLDNGLDVGVVEVENDLSARARRRRDRATGRRLRGRHPARSGRRRRLGRGDDRHGPGRRGDRAARRGARGLRSRSPSPREGRSRPVAAGDGLVGPGPAHPARTTRPTIAMRRGASVSIIPPRSAPGRLELGGGGGGGVGIRGRPGARSPGGGAGGIAPGGLPTAGRPVPPASGDCTPGGAAAWRGFEGSWSSTSKVSPPRRRTTRSPLI